MDTRNEISAYIENIGLILLSILFLAFPIVVTPITTDVFNLPKQILLGATVIVLLLFLGARMISDGSVKIRRTPFDVALILLLVVILLSALFSGNRADALIAYIPLFLTILGYFIIVNFIKNGQSLFFLVTSLILGACITSVITILSFFKIYPIPFAFTNVQTFSPLGSLLDQGLYLLLMLPIAIYLAWPLTKKLGFLLESGDSEDNLSNFNEATLRALGFFLATVLIVVATGLTLYGLFVTKPGGGLTLLPLEIGFQTAFAAISQDTGRVLQGFLLGSGFGAYITDFTRFKQAVPFNLNTSLWSLTFIRSSSFVLELLATTGVLGLASFGYLLFKILQRIKLKYTQDNPIFFAMLLGIIAGFILPFSPIIQIMFFFILAIFAVAEGIKDHENFFDVELHFVAFKQGFMPLVASPVASHASQSVKRIEDKSFTRALPIIFFIFSLIVASALGFFSYRYIASDILFQDSLVAYATRDGLKTYNNQTNAINLFPYRDAYYRIYAQVNLEIANSIASSQPRTASPSAQTQQTILTLIQQSINAGRNATVISPLTSLNWQNLASIYRSLIGFGRDAENFSIASQSQAIALDPNNPQAYLILGGIYYQLARWDDAQRQFQVAINLKPDFANAYYNYGHVLENKGDFANALVYYQTVKTLVANDPANLKKISDEIAVIQEKTTAAAKPTTGLTPAANQPQLGIDTSANQLPERKPPVEIEGPDTATKSAE